MFFFLFSLFNEDEDNMFAVISEDDLKAASDSASLILPSVPLSLSLVL